MKWVKKSSGVLWIAKEIFKIIIQFMIIWPTATTNAVASFVLAIRALVAAGTTGVQTAATLGAICHRKRRHVFHLALTRATWIAEDQKDQEDVNANLAEKDHLCFSISHSNKKFVVLFWSQKRTKKPLGRRKPQTPAPLAKRGKSSTRTTNKKRFCKLDKTSFLFILVLVEA